MRLVDVSAFYSPHGGGVKTYVEQKLRLGPELGVEVVILAPGDQHSVSEYGPRARIVTIPSPRLPLDRNYWYFGDQAALHAALDELRPDLVECGSPWRSPDWVANWRKDVPKSLFMHADPMSAYAYRWFDPLFPREFTDRLFAPYWRHLRRLSARYASVICASRDLQDRLIAGGVEHTKLIPMGVEANTFAPANRDPILRAKLLGELGLPPEAGLLITIGRLSAEKRWATVIAGVKQAARDRPLGLVILGEGREKPQVLRAISAESHMRLLEPERDRARFAAILASTDALVHGGDAETFGLATAEARASGVPVVVPDRGGAADHAADGGGLTYRAADPRSLAQAIGQLAAQGWPRSHVQVRTMREHFELLFAHYADLIAAHKA